MDHNLFSKVNFLWPVICKIAKIYKKSALVMLVANSKQKVVNSTYSQSFTIYAPKILLTIFHLLDRASRKNLAY